MPKQPVPENLDSEARIRVMKWFKDLYPHFDEPRSEFLKHNWEKARNWCLANGRQYIDYEAFFRNWVMKAMEINGWKPRGPKPKKKSSGPGRPRETKDDQENFSFLRDMLKKETHERSD